MKARYLAALFTPLLMAACFPAFTMPDQQTAMANAQADANAQVDAVMVERVDKARADARTGGAREAIRFAKELENAYLSGAVERGTIDGPKLLTDARATLAKAVDATPEEKPTLLAAEGKLLMAAAQKDEAEQALRASMKARPTLSALLPLAHRLDESGAKKDEIVDLCKATLAVVDTDDERYEVLLAAVIHTHAASIDGGLAWAGADNRAFFKKEKERRDAEAQRQNEKHRAEQKANHDKMMAGFEESRKKSDEKRSCNARCDADSSTCRSQCGTNGMCLNSCSDAKSHCYRSCR